MKFTELSEEQQKAALDIHRDINVDYQEWNEAVKEQFHDIMESSGFEGVESQYSGFWSQGDGASFTASNVDIEKFLRSQKRWTKYRSLHQYIQDHTFHSKVVRISHHYSHYNTTQGELHGDYYVDLSPKQEKLYEELEKDIDSFVTEQGKDYYSALEKEYEYMTSDEQVKERIINNDMDFEEDPRESSVTYL